MCTLLILGLESNEPILPNLFGRPRDRLIYFHAHIFSLEDLAVAAAMCPILEIDLAWAHSSFYPSICSGRPYIGHPEEFYTIKGKSFPPATISLEQFECFLNNYSSVKVLIDIKDEITFSYLEDFVKKVGAERCIVHAFIKNWTEVPAGMSSEPHWYREDIDLFPLDEILVHLGVPLIANCRGFSDQHVENNKLIVRMLDDASKCKSIVSLGLYYPEAFLPNVKFLKSINSMGYYAWVNGNVTQFQEKLGEIKYIAMSNDIQKCTNFSERE